MSSRHRRPCASRSGSHQKKNGRLLGRPPVLAELQVPGSVPVIPAIRAMPAMRTPAAAPPIAVPSVAAAIMTPAEGVPSPSVPAVPIATGLLDRVDGIDRAADAADGHGAGAIGDHHSAGEHCGGGSHGENTLAHVSPPMVYLFLQLDSGQLGSEQKAGD